MSDEQSAAGPDTPTDLPKRSWIAIVKRVFGQIKVDEPTDRADDDQTGEAEQTMATRGQK